MILKNYRWGFGIFILLCLFFFCNKGDLNILHFRDFYADGVADSNHLEKGHWRFYDLQNKNLVQEGSFDEGIRVDTWRYYSPVRYEIKWQKVFSKDSTIKSNIPDFLRKKNSDSTSLGFELSDTSRLLKLNIGVLVESQNLSIFEYENAIENEIDRNSISINSKNSLKLQTTCNNTFYFKKITGMDLQRRSYILLTIYRLFTPNTLVEITTRFDESNKTLGEEVFYSVCSNLYIKNKRFFDSNIDCEILLNSSRRINFKFGCN